MATLVQFHHTLRLYKNLDSSEVAAKRGFASGVEPCRCFIFTAFDTCGYRNPIVCNGPILPANLGVNPCLTITALAERIMSRAPPAPTAVTPGGTS